MLESVFLKRVKSSCTRLIDIYTERYTLTELLNKNPGLSALNIAIEITKLQSASDVGSWERRVFHVDTKDTKEGVAELKEALSKKLNFFNTEYPPRRKVDRQRSRSSPIPIPETSTFKTNPTSSY